MMTEILCVMWWGKMWPNVFWKEAEPKRVIDHAKKLHAYREHYANYGIVKNRRLDGTHCNPSTRESHGPRKKCFSFDF